MPTLLDNWNKQVLIIEETILTLSYEKADFAGTIKLLKQYKALLKKEINLYPFNSELKESLENRYMAVQNIFYLKAQLSDNRLTNDKVSLDKNKKTILDLISLLTKHRTTIQRNKEILMRHGVAERHIEAYLPSLMADAYDFLATLTWNCINWKKIDDVDRLALSTAKALAAAGDKVIGFYKKQIEWLKEGRGLLPNLEKEERLEFDNKISTAYSNVAQTIEETKKIIFYRINNSPKKNPVVDLLNERIKKWETEWKKQLKENSFTQERKKDYFEKSVSQSVSANVSTYEPVHKRKADCLRLSIPTTDFFNKKMKLLKESLSHSAKHKKARI